MNAQTTAAAPGWCPIFHPAQTQGGCQAPPAPNAPYILNSEAREGRPGAPVSWRVFFEAHSQRLAMDRYVVVGNPISHSLSPAIHAMFARETREPVAYEALRVEPGDFARAMRAF